MEEIRNRDCENCFLSNTCHHNRCLMNQPDDECDILIVAEQPTEYETKNDSVFVSPKYDILKRIFSDILNYTGRVRYTYLTKCYSAHFASIGTSDSCSSYFYKELQIYKPKVIVTLGDMAMSFLLKVDKITVNRGKVFEDSLLLPDGSFLDTKIIPTYSPSYASKGDMSLKVFAEDLQKATYIAEGVEVGSSETDVVMVQTIDQVKELCDYIQETKVCCFDFETSNADDLFTDDNFKATLLSISFQHGNSYVIPLYHYESCFTEDECREILSILQVRVFENNYIHKIGQNVKYDMHVLAKYGIEVYGRLDDTMLMHHALDNTTSHGLKEFSSEIYKQYDGYDAEVKKYSWEKVPIKILAPYAGADTDLTFRCYSIFEQRLLEDDRLYVLYRNLIMFVFRPLMYAERRGMPIDKEFLVKAIGEANNIMTDQENKLREYKEFKKYEYLKAKDVLDQAIIDMGYKIKEYDRKYEADGKKIWLTNKKKAEDKLNELRTGKIQVYEGLNLNSPIQLGDFIYGFNGLNLPKPYVKAKKGHAVSLDKKHLMFLGDKTGFIDDYLVYKSLAKMIGTYLQGIYNRLSAIGHVHTSFLQHGTETGRLSSRNPNLQNLPKVGKLKDENSIKVVEMVPKMFTVPEGYTMVQADFSQMELRLMAEYSEDETMINAYANDLDLHSVTASNMMGINIDEFFDLPKEFQKQPRTNAKAGNFGLIYGMETAGFQDYAKINYGVHMSLKEAGDFRENFFKLYSKLKQYHKMYIAKCRKFGYVRTFLGRKRWIPDIYNEQEFIRGEAERAAINTPIQGTGGEFALLAIAFLHHRLSKRCLFVNTIHDSIIYLIPDELVDSSVKIISHTCTNLPLLDYFGKELKHVTMKVDIEVSKTNWKELQPYESNN